MPLTFNRYGKGRVRVLRLDRSQPRHEVRELSVQAMLTGGFGASYTEGDNRAVVATDTIKNIVNVVARDNVAADTETFLGLVSDLFLDRYDQVERVEITAIETRWNRLAVEGAPHDFAFTLDGNGKPFATLSATRSARQVESGVGGFTFMKTTENGWADFHADEYRTLADTHDRIVATAMDATWTWERPPASYPEANARIMAVMLRDFVAAYSPGVQASMYRMGEAALAAVPELARIRFAMPNKHYIPMDLSRLPGGGEAQGQGQGQVFLPTDEPHGQIEAVIGRG